MKRNIDELLDNIDSALAAGNRDVITRVDIKFSIFLWKSIPNVGSSELSYVVQLLQEFLPSLIKYVVQL